MTFCSSSSTITALAYNPFSAPSVIKSPWFSKHLCLKSEVVTAFSIPSAPQNLFKANGRSKEANNYTTSSLSFNLEENVFSCIAHTPVSTLGKILKTTFFPFKPSSVKEDKSVLVRFNPEILSPTTGKFPLVITASPLNAVVLIVFYF